VKRWRAHGWTPCRTFSGIGLLALVPTVATLPSASISGSSYLHTQRHEPFPARLGCGATCWAFTDGTALASPDRNCTSAGRNDCSTRPTHGFSWNWTALKTGPCLKPGRRQRLACRVEDHQCRMPRSKASTSNNSAAQNIIVWDKGEVDADG
jgi:hypothetical protein